MNGRGARSGNLNFPNKGKCEWLLKTSPQEYSYKIPEVGLQTWSMKSLTLIRHHVGFRLTNPAGHHVSGGRRDRDQADGLPPSAPSSVL